MRKSKWMERMHERELKRFFDMKRENLMLTDREIARMCRMNIPGVE